MNTRTENWAGYDIRCLLVESSKLGNLDFG